MYIPSCCMSSILFEVYDSHVQTNFGPIQSSSQWLLGYRGQDMIQATTVHLIARLKMGGAIPPLPHMTSWHAMVQLHLHPWHLLYTNKLENLINITQKLLLIIWTFLKCQFTLSCAAWKLIRVTKKRIWYIVFTPKFSLYMAYLFLLCFKPRTSLIQSSSGINMYTVVFRFCLKCVF